MANVTRAYQASFGSANTGLSVGYTLLNYDFTTYAARTTSGVVEIVANSGCYGALVTHPADFKGHIAWDTGGGSPLVACETINPGILSSMGLDYINVETGYNPRQTLALILSMVAAKLSGADVGSGTVTVRDINDTADRLQIVVDGVGNRTAVTANPPA